MRALHLLKTPVGATWALRLIRRLASYGVDVVVAMPPGVGETAYSQIGIETIPFQSDINVRQPWRIKKQLEQLRSLVKTVQPDVIHSHFYGTTLSMRLALGHRSRIPRFFQVPGPLHLEHAPFRWLEVAVSSPTDRWIGTCKWTCERYLSLGIPPERVTLAYYGIDAPRVGPRHSGLLKKALGLAASTRVVGMVAYVYAPKKYIGQRRGIKGHEDLVDAIALLRANGRDVVGVFVGGPWGDKAVSYYRSLVDYGNRRVGGAAIFLGTRSDVSELYREFDVAVHPSHSENVGGAGESLLNGIPTIGTAVGGIPDAIQHGQTGWLVPPGEPRLLADRIGSVLDNPAEAEIVALRGTQHATDLLDLETNARRVFTAYQAALQASNERRTI